MSLIKFMVRLRFAVTSRARGSALIREEADRSLELVRSVPQVWRGRSVLVPAMTGIDEDMRAWSLYQVLEHNVIVNRTIAQISLRLASGKPVTMEFDIKRDVMPSAAPGEEQIALFEESVDRYLQRIEKRARLRGGATYPHPLFGRLTAHGWHGMLGLHLTIHRRQLEAIAAELGGTGSQGGKKR